MEKGALNMNMIEDNRDCFNMARVILTWSQYTDV